MNGNTSQARLFRCPTCGARQVPSPECRRCKCDLQLVLAARAQCDSLHTQYLRHLAAGEYLEAATIARRRYEIDPDETSRRLLSVAYVLLGRYQAALDVSAIVRE